MAVQYAPLFALETQFQAKNGRNLTGGFLRVFYAATDDPADTYSDYNLTRNPDRIVLDDNGRALVICDKSKAYRLEVYDADGMLLWTEEPVYCSGTGGGGVSITKVISTDGSISIDESVAGSTTTYDIGLAPNDSDEFLEWIKCSEEGCGSTWYPVFEDGTMETEAGQGVKVHGGHLYHFTNSFTVDPNGSGIDYDTFRVTMYCGDDVVDERDFDIDSSLNDPVLCEFSRDVVPSADTHVYFKLSIPATCKVSGEVQCHRIYSGINAVPDTCATKQWVSGSYQPLSGMSSYVPYSAVGNNAVGQVTGINGSAIAGGLDSASVSSIASSVASAYTESAFSSISAWTAEFSSISSKADSSSLSAYQPVSAMSGYATEAYVDAKVGDKLDATASSLFLTGLPDDLATTGDVASAVSGKLDKSASGEFYPMTGNPSGFLTAHQSLAGLATVEYVDSSVSSKLDTSAFASASAGFAPAGDYAFNSAVSSKLDASAMTSWIPYSALGYSGTAISGIGGSSLAGMGGGGVTGDYVEKSATEVAIGSGSTALKTAFAQGVHCSASSNSFAQGSHNSAILASLAQGSHSKAGGYSFAQGNLNIADGYSFAQGYGNRAKSGSFAQGKNNTAYVTSFAQGYYNSAVNTAAVFGTYNLHGNGDTASGDSAAFAIGDGTAAKARHDLMLVTKNGEITMYSSTADTVGLGLVSSIKAISAAATGGGVDSATVSAIASSYAESAASGKLDSSASGNFVVNSAMTSWIPYSALDYSGTAISGIGGSSLAGMGGNYTGIYPVNVDNTAREVSVDSLPLVTDSSMTAYGSAGSSVIGVNMNILSSKQDTLAFAYNTANQISSINGSALGGMDEAAVSGIASAYAQSAASSKLDTSAFNSADFYSTSNPSGFITGVDLTPYQPTSAMSSYATTAYVESGLSGKENVFSAGTGLEFVQSGSDRVLQVEAPVDIVAGPGIVIDNPDGNTLRVSVAQADETVLFEDTSSTGTVVSSVVLSESSANFEKVEITLGWAGGGSSPVAGRLMCTCVPDGKGYGFAGYIGRDNSVHNVVGGISTNGTSLGLINCLDMYTSNNSNVTYQPFSNVLKVYKVVGIHRITGGN